jgi:3',5'-cyclic AMP phosphodiesterase CpdA
MDLNPITETIPASGERFTLLHFGDLHLWTLGWDRDPAFKRLLGLANVVLRRGRKFPLALAHQFVERIGREPANGILCTGDLTTTALREEFTAARQLLRPLVERWGDRFIAIPGNHDRYTHRASQARLFETMFLDPTPCELPFAVELGAHWTLVAFDCCVPRHVSSRGHVPPATLARLEELLAEHGGRGRNLLVAGHYPIHYPEHHKPSWEHVLPERDTVRRLLMQYGVKAYLHGHVHYRWHLLDGTLAHLNCGPAGMNGQSPARRPGYLKITLGPEGLERVETHWLRPFPHLERHGTAEDWTVEELLPERRD